MAAAAPAMAGISLFSGMVNYSLSNSLADKSYKTQKQAIQDMMVQTKLQQNQEDIERMRQMERAIATQQVMLGARGISPAAGTSRAIFTEGMTAFIDDRDASRLNYAAKQRALARGIDIAKMNKEAAHVQNFTNFMSSVTSAGSTYFGNAGLDKLAAASKAPASQGSSVSQLNVNRIS